MIEGLIQKAGTLANIAGALSIISGLASFIFYAGIQIFGLISDVTGVVLFLLLIPVALAAHRILNPISPSVSLVASVIGIAAMLVYAVLQAALLLGLVQYEQSLPYMLLTIGLVGVWLFLTGVLAFWMDAFPAGLAWVGMIGGLGLVLSLVGFWIGGQEHPLAGIGFLVSFFALPIWCFWLSRLLKSQVLSFWNIRARR